MVNDWKEVSIHELPIHIGDGNYSSKYPKSSDFVDSGVPFITASDFNNGRISSSDFRYISEEQHSTLLKGHLKSGDVLIVTRGNGVGDIAWVDNEFDGCNINAQLVLLRADGEVINNSFLYYLLSSKEYKRIFLSYASGSAQPQLPIKALRVINLKYPPLLEQKAIANILGPLDEKIELNRQMNETLEAMAQALFKSWFVDFDPVIDNALAAGNAVPDELLDRAEQRKGIEKKDNTDTQSLFPDEFEFTEEMGWIPKGWKVRKLKSICRVLNGRAYKNTEFKEQGTPIVRIQNLSRSGKTVYSDLDLPEDKIICTEDFLYAWSATFGPHIWRGPKSIYHYHIWKMDVDESIVSRYFLYLAMFRKTESMKNAGTGSIFTHLTKKLMEGQDILIGNKSINSAFSNQVTAIFKKITKLDDESNSLTKLRDTLLPKLMSGELRIPDAAVLVDEVL